VRGGKSIPLKANVDKAIGACECVDAVIVVEHTKGEVRWGVKDVWYHELVADMPADCLCESYDAETPLFILYTSGSTGKPKGVLHTSGGYLLYAAMTHKYTFDYQDGDVYWCTADVDLKACYTLLVVICFMRR